MPPLVTPCCSCLLRILLPPLSTPHSLHAPRTHTCTVICTAYPRVRWITPLHHRGNGELHVWSDSNGTRLAFPSSPFAVHVNPGLPTADMSFVEGYTNQSGEKVDKKGAGANKASSPSKKPSDTARSDIWDEVIAGDAVSIKPILLDNFGNLTHVTDGALTAHAIAPDGKREAVSISQQAKPNGTTIYELRHEVTLRGEHEVHVLLSSNPIKGSPILLDVQPAPPEPHVCKLLQPPSTENLVADYDAPTTLLITTFDKFGNACKHGGLTIGARIQLIKQSNSDMTVLMPNNHNVSVEDYNDGTYGVTIQIKINATVRLTVNLDKNLPANSGELPSVVRDTPPCTMLSTACHRLSHNPR